MSDLPAREIPEEFVRLGKYKCMDCGVEKRVADDNVDGGFPTARGRKTGPPKVWLRECRTCRNLRYERGDKPPWTPEGYPAFIRRKSPEHESFAAVSVEDVKNAPEEDEDEVDNIHHEGRISYRIHRTRERDPKVRQRKLEQLRTDHGELACEACGLMIESVYGTPDGAVYECHHIVPLHASGETQTTLDDVVLLCPTCHRAAHRTTPWPTRDEMRSRHQ